MELRVTGVNGLNQIIRQDVYPYKRKSDLKGKIAPEIYTAFTTNGCATICDKEALKSLEQMFPKAKAIIVEVFSKTGR